MRTEGRYVLRLPARCKEKAANRTCIATMIQATRTPIGFCPRRPHCVDLLRAGAIAGTLAVALLVTGAMVAPAHAQQSTKASQDPDTVRWDGGSFHAGENLRLDPRVRVQGDLLLSEPLD